MSRVRQLAGGGRGVEVSPERLDGWFGRFAERHGGVRTTRLEPHWVEVTAVDGATAAVVVPFGPLPPPHGKCPGLAVSSLVKHVRKPRRIGLVLVRRGSHSVGIAYDGQVEQSSTDRRLVRGRSKAGGWSQQRFARRRKEQARRAWGDAAETVQRLLLPVCEQLDAVVLGGDKSALQALRADRRLHPVLERVAPDVLEVPEPRRAVLDEAARRAISVEVEVHEM